MARVVWSVEFHSACEAWADGLAQSDAEALVATVRVLRDQGPTLGRPLVDTITGSRHANMKELRPGSTGRSEIRVLFAFDPERKAILLVGGDKSTNWQRWYVTNIPIADERLDGHLAQLEQKRSPKTTTQDKSRRGKGRGKR